MKKLLDKLSIRTKLLLMCAALIGVAGLTSAAYVAHLANQTALHDLRAEATALTQIYQQVLLEPLRLGDEFQVYELIAAPFRDTHSALEQAEVDERELISIVLLDDAGHVLATSHPLRYPLNSVYPVTPFALAAAAYNGAQQVAQDDEQQALQVMQPVGEGGVKYANLLVSYSLAELNETANEQVAQASLMIGALMVVLMGVMWLLINWLTRSILSLNQEMHGLAGQYGLTLDATLHRGRDEVKQLSDIFTQLAQRIRNYIGEIGRHDEAQQVYLQTISLLQDAVVEFTPEGHLLRASDAWTVLTGESNFAPQISLAECVHSEDVALLLEQFGALQFEQKQQINVRFRLLSSVNNNANNYIWVEGRFAPVSKNGHVIFIRGVVRDISSTYLKERQISHMALHDALTDLPNRVLLEDRIAMAIPRAERAGMHVALGFIDLDHFKQVNDHFGHKVGDRLLKEVTQRLQTVLRSSDTLCRWGGDEFVILCPDLKSLEDAREVSQKLARLTHENIDIDGTNFPFTFSGGFAVYPDDASNSEMLLSQADRAMFYAKAQGRNNIQFFNAIAKKEPGRKSFYIQSRLAAAIQRKEIKAWLQPLISAQTGEVIGAEVLARWHEPEQGWIPPSVFIPMAESMGLIDQLGQSVWQDSLKAFPLLPAGHRLSINLSKRQLFSSNIVQQFCEDLARANIQPSQIMLEITESVALSDVDFARERIAELDALGFGIAVDDFGVGHSSLAQLHEIPANEIKLDIAFVKRIHLKNGRAIADAIISIAKSLDMECVAEGVEDATTAKLLTEMGVDILQGYYFSKALPIDEYLLWLAQREVNA
ncbi:MAG: EAL domain-containing protein [Sideroxydans sp.]|nr:EAL domain-containing protein [Sideroxydans sp.]